jgi:hypothetical protein|tara:strand:- start:516 stop:698 length:183 start_codon:yes stop_codon:yes gene_type:complete
VKTPPNYDERILLGEATNEIKWWQITLLMPLMMITIILFLICFVAWLPFYLLNNYFNGED